MKRYILSLTFLFLAATVFSQSIDSVIQIKHGYFGIRYYRNGTKLSPSEVSEALKTNDEAYKKMQGARTSNLLYYLLGIPGGGLLGYGLAQLSAIFIEPQWGLIAAGTALSVTATVFYYKSRNQAQTAIDIYNAGLRRTSFHKKEIRISVQGNGFVVGLNF